MSKREKTSGHSDDLSTSSDPDRPTGSEAAVSSTVELFSKLMKHLREEHSIHRGVLITRQPRYSRFVAIATVSPSRERRQLNLLLPGTSSLIEKVAEHGQMYSDCAFDLFSGNRFEQNLLIDDDTRSYALIPLKHDGKVVGVVGFSATADAAFASIEAGALDDWISELATQAGLAWESAATQQS
jgi:GAF domain-containing protein